MHLLSIVLGLLVSVTTVPQSPPSGSSFIVTVAGVPSAEGHIYVALYRNAADFPKTNLADYTRKVPASAGLVKVDFADLSPGKYAVAVFHDADGSGSITTSLLGLPQEAYGFGNDARGTFGPPSFAAAVVEFDGKSGTRVTVK